MTPGERQYDIELANSMRTLARSVRDRSRKLADTLTAGAARIDALSSAAPIDPTPSIDEHGEAVQPASAPDQPKRLEPVRD